MTGAILQYEKETFEEEDYSEEDYLEWLWELLVV